jgi:hypothetical protein
VSSGMLRRVTLVRTDVSEERSASFIRATIICELGTTLAVTSNRRTLRRNTKTGMTKIHIIVLLCKVCGFHLGDYDECRVLGYITRVRTSPETHYFSTTEPSRLMLYKI